LGIPRLEALDEGPDGDVLKGRVFAAEEADEVGVQASRGRVPRGDEGGRVVGCRGRVVSGRGRERAVSRQAMSETEVGEE
jgi:hypothetical protein